MTRIRQHLAKRLRRLAARLDDSHTDCRRREHTITVKPADIAPLVAAEIQRMARHSRHNLGGLA